MPLRLRSLNSPGGKLPACHRGIAERMFVVFRRRGTKMRGLPLPAAKQALAGCFRQLDRKFQRVPGQLWRSRVF